MNFYQSVFVGSLGAGAAIMFILIAIVGEERKDIGLDWFDVILGSVLTSIPIFLLVVGIHDTIKLW